MNFLAHLFLSDEDEDLMIGNFIADFIKNKEVKNYSKRVQKGVFLHRQIDTFTDNHPMVRRGTHRLQPDHHKYAPVIVDIFYDYLLANNWKKYADQSLKEFTQFVYTVLEKRIDELPIILQKRLPVMIEHDWLFSYKKESGMRFTFDKLKDRISKPEYLENVMEHLMEQVDDFNEEFNLFFPDVILMVSKF